MPRSVANELPTNISAYVHRGTPVDHKLYEDRFVMMTIGNDDGSCITLDFEDVETLNRIGKQFITAADELTQLHGHEKK
jgi:hypothetical protein